MTNSTVGVIGFGQSVKTTVCQNNDESPLSIDVINLDYLIDHRFN